MSVAMVKSLRHCRFFQPNSVYISNPLEDITTRDGTGEVVLLIEIFYTMLRPDSVIKVVVLTLQVETRKSDRQLMSGTKRPSLHLLLVTPEIYT